MSRAIEVLRAGPGVSVQDGGRPGYLAQGLSRGGALDRLALAEGAALLGQSAELAALEVAGSFVTLRADDDLRVALTGAPMRARIDGAPVTWNASHALPRGATLEITAQAGGVGYVHVGGGIDTPLVLGSRSAHIAAGVGEMIEAGTTLPVGADQPGRTGQCLDPAARFEGGTLRIVPGVQADVFDAETTARFLATTFTKDTRGNRMGQRLLSDGVGFGGTAGLTIVSDVVVPGDIQITGDGTPFVLMAECQTTGGYPRIGTVLPCDLPRLVQAPAGVALRFKLVTAAQGFAAEQAEATRRAGLRKALRPLVRDPRDISDLLAYQLIGGVTAGDELDTTTTDERGKE